MKSVVNVLACVVLLLAVVSDVSEAQRALPVGSYQVQAGEGFAGGFDLSTVTVDVAEGSWTIMMGAGLVAKSNIKFEGTDHVTITDLEGEMMCPGTAKYQIAKTDKGYKLTPIEDPCPERGDIISTLLFVKKG